MKLVTSRFDCWQISKLVLILLIFITSIITLSAAEWKWEQLPDPNGVDIDFVYPNQLADDWLCTDTGPIRTICFAYSWWNDIVGSVDSVHVQVWTDVPDPDGAGPLFSHPGALLWDHWFVPGFPELLGSSSQAWYNPWLEQYIPANHNLYYRRAIDIPDGIAFMQTSGTVYWLSLSVALVDPIGTKCGWKTTFMPWNDKAVFWMPGWEPFPNDPPVIQDLAFKLSNIDYNGECPVELSSFSGSFNSGLCQIRWVTESETNVQGFNIYRSTINLVSTATKVNGAMISATNTTQTASYQFQDTDVSANQAYYYWLESNDYSGASDLYGPINISIPIDNTPVQVAATSLSSIYPNPARSMNPIVDASIKSGETGVMSIYNLKGQLVNSFNLQSGTHKIEWNRIDSRNHKCADGVYFYRLVTPSVNETRKVLILN